MDLSECRILHIRGHVEIYTKQGEFVVSGDTEYEALDDFKDMVVDWARQEVGVCA